MTGSRGRNGAVQKLMFGAAERWRPTGVNDFERCQMAATREELDQKYKAQTGLAKRILKNATDQNLSSSSRI